jgi:methanogenic corrinoid protein MtbC1
MHRNLGMTLRAQKPCAFHTDGAVAKSSSFGGARNDTDVLGHKAIVLNSPIGDPDHTAMAAARDTLLEYNSALAGSLFMTDSRIDSLAAAILEGDCAVSVRLAEQLRISGVSTQDVVTRGVEAAMSALDGKCTAEHFNLLEIMLAGRAVTEVMKLLYPSGSVVVTSKPSVVLAALEGDVHDLGKNILKTVLTGSGYRVVDCGKDCPLSKLIATAVEEQPLAVGISGLITPIIPRVKQVRELLRVQGLAGVKVMAGGAALKQASPDRLNVDFVAESAFDGLHYLDALAGGGQ